MALALTVLSAPHTLQAEEQPRSATSTLTVSTQVVAQCRVGTTAVATDDLGRIDVASAPGSASVSCPTKVAPITSVAYETVSLGTAGQEDSVERPVLTVLF